jgi:predicted DNA-binding transcriptional regulator AlpA
MTTRLNLDQLAQHLAIDRRYVRDNLVKRPDFPRPLVLSRYLRYWLADEVEDWMLRQRERAAGRPRS